MRAVSISYLAMADDIPAALRQADINIYKCATKAAQLQTARPIVAYWCSYNSYTDIFRMVAN